eukprot:TRINITY_DN4053_c0_g1_i1.p1 TRINITY_DN4053_c0_g1~~TRINITY_DN4053_c0_g1_i1.p1  ORF type:complete len:447 (+),score=107.64 TRINITY_DN4053_c0_g1_i1:49-1341(+)
MSAEEDNDDLAKLLSLLPKLKERIRNGDLDETLRVMEERKRKLNWEKLPEKIILLRHGESQGNVDKTVYSIKGDSQLEITEKGLKQAMEAGGRLKNVVGDGKIFVAVSPFARAVQTLYGLYKGGFPREQVGVVHHDPRIREQEFGNFQTIGLTAAVREEEKTVGRFYYRRPNAESSADVFDRVCAFWDALLSDGPTSLLFGRRDKYDSCLLVTHGLTIRLLLMAVFQWSIETFETVFNLGNCEHITMRKNLTKCCYELCKEESYPPRIPWASRKMWVRFDPDPEEYEPILKKINDLQAFRESIGFNVHEIDKTIDDLKLQYHFKCAKPYTVLDYLSLKPPRSMQVEQALSMAIPGHNNRGSPSDLLALIESTPRPDPSTVYFIDWWGDKGTYINKMLHVEMDRPVNCSKDLDVSPGGRANLLPSGKSVSY